MTESFIDYNRKSMTFDARSSFSQKCSFKYYKVKVCVHGKRRKERETTGGRREGGGEYARNEDTHDHALH